MPDGRRSLPGLTHNPLFLLGPKGSGKTHLIHAIVWQAAALPKQRVIYRSAERFTAEFEFANAIGIEQKKCRLLAIFRAYYSGADILLLDDIQMLSGKETLVEFLHLFDTLLGARKQLFLSGSCRPDEIASIIPQLVTRLERGLAAER